MQSLILEDFIGEFMGMEPEAALRLYFKSLGPGKAGSAHVALGLLEKARSGGFDSYPDAPQVLRHCLALAPDEESIGHLARALAAFGRAAQDAAPVLVARLEGMRAVDDATYWALDGAVWALGYLGGEPARACLGDLASEDPNRAVAVGSVYEGALEPAEREARFAKNIAGALELVDNPEPGLWRKTRMPRKGLLRRAAKKKAWSVR